MLDGELDENIRSLVVVTIQDLENLEGGVASSAIPLAELLSDYRKEIREVDPLCSLHNFIAHSKYLSRMKPSPLVFQKAVEVVDSTKAVPFPVDGVGGR